MSEFVIDTVVLDRLSIGEDGLKECRARIMEHDLKASARIWFNSYLNEDAALVAFFEDMASDWSGWSGIKKWSGLEARFSLEFRHDRVGQVTGTVELGSGFQPEDWLVTTQVHTEPGSLAQLAEDLRRFFEAT